MTREEVETLRLSVNNKGVEKKMKTILDVFKDEGRREGEIKTIKTVASLCFQETSERSPRLLPKIKYLKLLNQACQFALTASSSYLTSRILSKV